MWIGIDPGKTIGLCLYDDEDGQGRVIDAQEAVRVQDAADVVLTWWRECDWPRVAIEWPRFYAKGGNDIADTCSQAGALFWAVGGRLLPGETGTCKSTVIVLTRAQVVKALTAQMGQEVRGDAGVWAALCDLHGGKAEATARKVGCLAALSGKPHARAALAVAWAASQRGAA